MTTIGLGIGKKLRIIEGTKQDFMLGEKARIVGVRSYADLIEMERRQTKWLRPTATAIAALFGAKDTLPDTVKAADGTSTKIADENTTEQHNAPVAVGGA